ncbi:MAG TPA: ABC transporter permease [Pyrinomonadaceae bacterium]
MRFWQDIDYGARKLRKDLSFTIVAAFTIALGIGANTTILSAINALLLHPFAFHNADRLVVVRETLMRFGLDDDLVSPANYVDLKNGNSVFENMTAAAFWSAHITEGERPEGVAATQVTTDFFSAIGAEPALGRTFVPEDGTAGNNFVVVLSDTLWRQRFGRQQDIIGRVLRINDREYKIVGVMPPNFAYPRGGIEAWTPFVVAGESWRDRNWRFLQVIGLLKPGVTVAQAQSEMNVIAQRLAQDFPKSNEGRGLRLTTLHDAETAAPRPYLMIGFGAVAFVLLLACVNVANLMLLRATAREKEIAIRTALGASRSRIIQGLLIESVLLALVGGALGLCLGLGAVHLLRTAMPESLAKTISGWDSLGFDWRVFGFALLLSAITGVVFGILPALQAAKRNPEAALREAGRVSTQATGRQITRSVLVTTEIALALILLVGAGLMLRSFIASMHAQLGFKPEHLLTFEIDLPLARYREQKQTVSFYEQLMAAIRSKPGVIAAGAVNTLPITFNQVNAKFAIEGRASDQPDLQSPAYTPVVVPGYFNAMGIALLQGRDFADTDTLDSPPVAIINDALARRRFPNENPLGKRVLIGKEKRTREIVGVVQDVKQKPFVTNVSDQSELAIYMPHKQNPWHLMTLVVRTTSDDPGSVAFQAQSEVQKLDKDLPLNDVRMMNQVIADSLAPQRLASVFFSIFGLIALVLAAVGLYAVVSYSVVQRTNEIGIRMALGAQTRDVLRLMMAQGMWLILIGIAIGLVAAYAGARLMASILFGVGTNDLVTFVGVPLFLIVIALIACYVPSRRATKVDPLVALRGE